MKELSITQIENAFVPAKEIYDAEKFAGREDLIKNSYFALLSEGTNIAVFGNRGIGKSSLARQIMALSTGKNQILEKIGLKKEKTLDYLTIYYACGDSIDNYQTLLKKLLTTNECLADWVYAIPSASKEIQKINGGLDVGIAKLGGDIQTEKTEIPVITAHDMDVVFANVINAISKEKIARDGILIVIDEYDRIKDHQGFAAFLKSSATNIPQVKFCIIGVAQDLQSLLKSHASSDRLFAGGLIYVPPMTPKELGQIINCAERIVNNKIVYDAEARETMISLAQGHPYIIHLIGKYSLRSAFINKLESIHNHLIFETLNLIAYSNSDPILENRYKVAVRTSLQREIVIKAFAEQDVIGGEIQTANVYKKCIDMGVDNPSVYVGQLVLEEYGSELSKTRETYYCFRDSLFKAYVAAHPTINKR